MSTAAESLSAEAVLLREDANGVATLTLNRPAQYNALNEALLEALEHALDDLEGDEASRVVVIAAAGTAFCTGHDFKEMRANRSDLVSSAIWLFHSAAGVLRRGENLKA